MGLSVDRDSGRYRLGLVNKKKSSDVESGRDESTERILGSAVHYVDREISPLGLATVLDELLSDDTLRGQYQRRATEIAGRLLRTWEQRIEDEVTMLKQLATGQEPTDLYSMSALRGDLEL